MVHLYCRFMNSLLGVCVYRLGVVITSESVVGEAHAAVVWYFNENNFVD